MLNSNGRRIKRHVLIKANSIRFLKPEELEKLKNGGREPQLYINPQRKLLSKIFCLIIATRLRRLKVVFSVKKKRRSFK